MTKKVRWGILSTAKIGLRAVIPATRRSPNSEVLAIASRDVERARAVAEDLGIPRYYGSYEELLADGQVEAVYNPLPNHLHHEWTIAAARAGKHVLCEKPLALTAVEAEEMVNVCAAEGVKLMEAFMYRLHPRWVRVGELVSSGALGSLRAIQARFTYFNDDPANIRNRRDTGGGALLDIGCYPINVARMLFGEEPVRVRAAIQRDQEAGTDIVTSALLEFGAGHAGFLVSTRAEPGQWVTVLGTRGRVELDATPPSIPDRTVRRGWC